MSKTRIVGQLYQYKMAYQSKISPEIDQGRLLIQQVRPR